MNNQLTKREKVALAIAPALYNNSFSLEEMAEKSFDFADAFLAESAKRAGAKGPSDADWDNISSTFSPTMPEKPDARDTEYDLEYYKGKLDWVSKALKEVLMLSGVMLADGSELPTMKKITEVAKVGLGYANPPETPEGSPTPTHHVPLAVSREFQNGVEEFFDNLIPLELKKLADAHAAALANVTPDPAREALKEIVRHCSTNGPLFSIKQTALRGLEGK